MKPTSHLILTAIAFYITDAFASLGLKVLYSALALTIAIDVIDHSLIILLIKTSLTGRIKSLLFRLRFREAYKKYSRERWSIGKAFLHNLVFFVIITLMGIFWKSPTILLGISFHFACDMLSDVYYTKKLNSNWTFEYLFKRAG